MLVVFDKKGNVVASTGGTVSGIGTVGLETAGTMATAGAIYYGAKAIQNGVQHAKVSASHSVNGNVTATANINGLPQNINIHDIHDINIGNK